MSQAHRPLQKQWKIVSYYLHHCYCARQSFQLLTKQKIQTLIFTFMMGLTLVIPSLIGLVYETTRQIESNLKPESEVTIYIKQSTDQSEITDIINRIDQENLLEKVHYITPDEGLTQLAQSIDMSDLLSTIDVNPLPGALVGTPMPFVEVYQLEVMKDQLLKKAAIESIDLNLSWFGKLKTLLHASHAALITLAGILGSIMLLIICCLTYLLVQKSEKDIEVYELVGANKRFIKRPFLYTGFYLGALAAVANWGFLLSIKTWSAPYLSEINTAFHVDFSIPMPSILVISLSIMIPILLGTLGAHLALWQFFRQRKQAN